MNQSLVDEYAKVTAQRKALKIREAELRDKLIKHLRKHECPNKGPFVVKLIEAERSIFCWEDYVRKIMRRFGIKTVEMKKMIGAAKIKAGTQPVYSLYVDVNPNWKE